jgi:hypothetical protein
VWLPLGAVDDYLTLDLEIHDDVGAAAADNRATEAAVEPRNEDDWKNATAVDDVDDSTRLPTFPIVVACVVADV